MVLVSLLSAALSSISEKAVTVYINRYRQTSLKIKVVLDKGYSSAVPPHTHIYFFLSYSIQSFNSFFVFILFSCDNIFTLFPSRSRSFILVLFWLYVFCYSCSSCNPWFTLCSLFALRCYRQLHPGTKQLIPFPIFEWNKSRTRIKCHFTKIYPAIDFIEIYSNMRNIL